LDEVIRFRALADLKSQRDDEGCCSGLPCIG
jgi:hypothetical protein